MAKRDKFNLPDFNPHIITDSTRAVYEGDASLWLNGLRTEKEEQIYARIYGFEVNEALALRATPILVTMISMRGTVAADPSLAERGILAKLDGVIHFIYEAALALRTLDGGATEERLRALFPEEGPMKGKFMEFEGEFQRLLWLSDRGVWWERVTVFPVKKL